MNQDEIVGTLNDLIKVCNDGSEGFKACAENANVDMPKLKALLVQWQQECAVAADALRAIVAAQGADPASGTTASGTLHRGWLNIKTAIAGKNNIAVLEECERGEDVTKAAYRKALDKDLPLQIRMVLEQQYQDVLRNHDLIKDLRDQEKRAHHVA